jgi:hypothetical protein
MTPATAFLFHWAPRVFGILFAAFLSVFALDVFHDGLDFGRILLALIMHLVPAAVVLGALAVAWRWERAGGIVFMALGAWYLATTWGRFHWSAYVVIAGPLILLGLLFELDGWYAKRRRGIGP